MGIKILPIVLEDIEEIAALIPPTSASPRMLLEFQNCKQEEWLAWNAKAFKGEIVSCLNHPAEGTALKAVDEESGRIASMAIWGWSPRATELIWADKNKIPLPEGTNTSLRNKFTTGLQDLEENLHPSGNFFELLELMTSPSFQHRGIGSQLVKVGLERADEEGVKCFLSASPMGAPVYKKLGFEEVGRLEIPLEEFGGEGTHVHLAMVREPLKGVKT